MKVFNIIFEIIIILTILSATLLIGPLISYNCVPFNLVIISIGIIFLLFNLIFKKKKIIESKLDVAIFILCLSPIIPLIFGTYISLNDTIQYLLEYLSCLSLYIILKQVTKTNPKSINRITSTLIISSVILSIIGIDNMTTRYSFQYLEKLGLPFMSNFATVMASNFGTTNTFAVILGVSLILILDKLVNERKTIYSLALFLNLSTLILTYSRGGWIAFFVFFVINLIMQKDKKKTLYMLYSIILAGILSIIYVFVWMHIKKLNMFAELWGTTIGLAVLSFIILKLSDKFLYNRIAKIKTRTVVIIISVIIVIVISVFFIGTKLTRPLRTLEAGNPTKAINYEISNIKPNTEYSFKFDIEAKSKAENVDNYSIVVIEEDKYLDEITSHQVTFNNFTGTKEISFTTSKDTIRVTLKFRSVRTTYQNGLIINKFTINGKVYPLKYIYLPHKIVEQLRSISIKDKSVSERGAYYRAAFRIIKNSPFVGQGGNSWNYLYEDAQDYTFTTSEVHSYPLQLFMDYGIIGIVSIISIIVLVLLKKKSAYIIALLLLLAHSFMDFDMSFFYTLVLMFSLLAIIEAKDEENNMSDNMKLTDKVVSIALICVLLGANIFGIIQYNKEKIDTRKIMEQIENMDSNEAINIIKPKQKEEKYIFYSLGLAYLDYSNVSDENLEYMYKNIVNTHVGFNFEKNLYRNELILTIASTTKNEEMKRKLLDIILAENEKTIEFISNKDRVSDGDVERYLSIQEMLYNEAKYLLENSNFK